MLRFTDHLRQTGVQSIYPNTNAASPESSASS